MKVQYLNKLTILSFLFLIFNLGSQEMTAMDQDFLDSLPEAVQDDLMAEMKYEKNDIKNLQSKPSSALSKYETIDNWEKFKRQQSIENNSERYGLKLFNTMQSSFMPINEPNFGNNYIIDYGDSFSINTFGSKSLSYLADVKRDGTILVEEIGSLMVAGLNFEQVTDLITKKYQMAFIGMDIVVNLAAIRDINILVTGNVAFPGIYTLSGNSNILQALNIAGGITENGTLRGVTLKRNNQDDQSIDLYDALLLGNIENIPFLMSGDSIHIGPVSNLVRAGYGFNNTAVFELKQKETLADLTKYASGLNNASGKEIFKLVRFENNEFKSYELNFEDFSSFGVQNMDSIYADKEAIGSVLITGNIKYPGKYSISSSDRILDIIVRSGGYTDTAYPFGGSLLRESARDLENIFADKSYNNLITFIISNPAAMPNNADGLGFLLSELKNYEPIGRVIVELDETKLKENIQDNIYLTDGDQIHIPPYTSNVFIFGEVGNPGSVLFKEADSMLDYIERSGGLTRYSSKDSIFIVSPNGETKKAHISGLRKYLADESEIYPGSVIYVPRHVGKIEGINYYATIAPIFSSLALSLASLNTITNN
ncbi:SLBB domain-containing protein [Gammaproteobacteria bacterium]|nr:SLBB domain-containing protein [Gammaproteobacteria bacterium]MDC0511195.1 SLBB domain-containing protein [bacterium]